MSRDNIISFMDNVGSARQRVADAKVQAIVTQLRDLTGSVLPRLLQDLFENLDDDLFELADKSGSDLMQTRYFEAMRELRKLRTPIQDAMVRGVLGHFDAFWNGEPLDFGNPALEADSEDMALVTEEDLEENLAVTAVVTRAENQFHHALHALGQRFAFLIGSSGEVSPSDNPVGPRALAESFRRGLSLWHGELPVKLVIFKLFERHVVSYIGGLYDDVNYVLISADVLPTLVRQVKRNPVSPSVQRARGEAEAEQEAEQAKVRAEQTHDADLSANLLSIISDLLATRRAESGVEARLAHLPVVPSTQVVSALDNLQQDALVEAASTLNEARELREQMLTNLTTRLELGSGEHPVKRLETADQDILDVVSMVFDFILDDPNLPDAMKALLSRLQLPMVKVAMIDKTFFSNKNHPARRLLNNVARSVLGWVDDGDRTPQSLYGRVESVVTRVLTDFTNDMRLFEELDKAFAATHEREARSAQVAEERMAQVTRGQEHLKVARRRVETVIKQCLGDLEGLPQPATDLLNEPWRDVLLLSYLREGEDSETWREAVDVAHRLVWSVTPKVEQAQRQELLKVIPDLLRRMREGLANISYDQHKAAALFKQLQACHIDALRGKAVENMEITRPNLTEPESELPPVVLQDACYQKAKALKVGQWLEWQHGDGKLRGKLSWKSDLTGACVFVNRKGLKNAELRLDELAALFREDKVVLLADAGAPLMDRALTAMLDVLKNTAPSAEPSPA